MDFRFTAHDPQTGDFLHRLPRPEKVQIGDTFGTRGTLDLTYSSRALHAKIMPTFVEIRQEVTFDGGMTWAPIGPNYLRLSGSHEDTDQAGMREAKFVSREWLLSKARVGAGDLPLIENKRPFYQSSPGAIMRTLLLEAGDRGAAQGIEIGDFTASQDSSGHDWPKVATIYYQPGLPILSVLENLVEQGLCDYRMDGNTMRLYAPETTMGRDLTTGADPVRVHGSVTEAPVNYTLEDLTTSALLIGENGFEVEVDNPSAPDDYGRLEATIEQGGVSDEGTARVMIDEALQKGSREIREITRTQRVEGLRHIPYRDYRVGDFVQVRDQGVWERYRVREIQAVRDDKGWTVHTVINDRLQELLLKLAKRTSGIVNGSQGSGGDGTPPAPPALPGVEPEAPEGLIVDQQVYLDARGTSQGVVTASWAPVTESTKGRAIEIGGYELWWRGNTTLGKWTRIASTDDGTSVSHSPVRLTSREGEAMEYQWKVRAVAEASARPGPFSNVVTMTMTQDTEPPPRPSLPIVETDLRIITVSVDGLDEDGEAMPPDFNHTRIYFAATANMADAVWVGSLTQPGSWNSGSMEADEPVWVAVSAVDNVGNESPMTASQEIVPRSLVDDDAIRDALENAQVDAIEEAVTTAGGRQVHNKTTPPVDSPDDAEFDVWQQWTTLEDGATLVGAWMHDGTQWVKRDTTEEYVPRIHIGEGTFGVMSGQRLIAGSVTADKMLIGGSENMIPMSGVDAGAGIAPHTTFGGRTAQLLTNAQAGREYANAIWIRGQEDGQLGSWDQAFAFNSGGLSGPVLLGRAFPVKVGQQFRADTYIMRRGVEPDGLVNARLELYWYGFDGSHLATTRGDPGFGIYDPSKQISVEGVAPEAAAYLRVYVATDRRGDIVVWRTRLLEQKGTVFIGDGAIVAPKIAALAIEADKIAANAITADKIRAGAIDGKLITGATVRTAASGARVQLDAEGIRAFNSSGTTVLSTANSSGDLTMRGILSQTAKGVTLEVGSNYEDGFPAIQWDTGQNYYYPAGLTYQEKNTYPELLLQGPGGADSFSHLLFEEYGRRFILQAGRTNSGWKVEADPQEQWMRVGHIDNTGPFAYMKKGFAADGELRLQHNHPTANNFTSVVLQDRYLWMGSRDDSGDLVGLFYANTDGSGINAGSRRLELYTSGAMYMPHLEDGSGAPIGRSTGKVVTLTSARKYKILEEPLETTVESLEDKILAVEPKTWIRRSAAEQLADHQTAVANGSEPERDIDSIGSLDREPGLIAEDLEDAGLGMFVGYEDGEPEWVMYDRIAPALIPIIRRLRDRVDDLEQQLGAA